MAAFPSLFISHGSPDIVLRDTPAKAFLNEYGRTLGKPGAIIIASAHYETERPAVSAAPHPETIYDFRGFADDLYALKYPAPGAVALADEVGARLKKAGIEADVDHARGYDHGVWIPLMLLYPQADVPIVQLSVCPDAGAAAHVALGEALRPLREDGAMVIGSGTMTHNLRAFFEGGREEGAVVPDWVKTFRDWIVERAKTGARDDLIHYRERAPFARENHPSEEHFLPFFVSLGASDTATGEAVHASYDYGVLAMDALAFH